MSKNLKEYVIDTISNFDEVFERYLSRKTCKELKVLEDKIYAMRNQIVQDFVVKYENAFKKYFSDMGFSSKSYEVLISVNYIYFNTSIPFSEDMTKGMTKGVRICIEKIHVPHLHIEYVVYRVTSYPGTYPRKISGALNDIIKESQDWMDMSFDKGIGDLIKNYFKELLELDWLKFEDGF